MNPASAALRMFLFFLFFVTAWGVNIMPRLDLYLHGKVVDGIVYGSVNYSGLWANYAAEDARNTHGDVVVYDGYEARLGKGRHKYKGEKHVEVYYSTAHPENFVLKTGAHPYSILGVIFEESAVWIVFGGFFLWAFLIFYRQTLAERDYARTEQERQRMGKPGETFRAYALPAAGERDTRQQ
jgi:hypothetical protein